MRTVCLLSVALLAACGGSGGPAPAAAPDTPAVLTQQNNVVVRYDLNGDGDPDLVTLDESFTIVAAIESTGGADPLDTTDLRRGQAIDANIAGAVASYLQTSVGLASETELEVVDAGGRSLTVTVFE